MADANQVAEALRAENEKLHQAGLAQYHERMKGHCTPTQIECDLIKLGGSPKKKDDGSGPDPFLTRQLTATPGGATYQTRTMRGQPAS